MVVRSVVHPLILTAIGILALTLFIVTFVLIYQKEIEQSKVVLGAFEIMAFLEAVRLVFYFVSSRGRGRFALQRVPLMYHRSHRFDVYTATSTAI